jgi:hypothetical protein
MFKLTKYIDFWLGDFKWYRTITENHNQEWLCKQQTSLYGHTSKWARYPKGTFQIHQILGEVTKDYPLFNELNQIEQRTIVQHYINKYYNINGKEL